METRYSRAQKDEALEALRKQLENGVVLYGEMQELSKRLNIPSHTLHAWKTSLKRKLVNSGEIQPEASGFSSKDKFQAVLDTYSMSELELGEYLRKHGILKEELVAWKMAMEDGFNKSTKTDAEFRRELANEKASVKRLEKELKRKTEALAETAALLVLQKKHKRSGGSPGTTNSLLRSPKSS